MTRRAPRTPPPAESKRAAIYTRKSTAAGLEQEFNSLDAQYEACLAYIQRQPGWTLVDERYDDGGFTGANIERPAFQRLLAAIDCGKIDVVVVYKVDRLSRSLLDFTKVMERFNAAGASFVSITQNFSTADAMGRLTLNMLMSFAEFEREMIAERTRDKIAAARRRGKWTGGPVPLGYQVKDKRLVIDELGAIVVREIFALYLQHRQMAIVARELAARGRQTTGRRPSARPWTKDSVARILRNPIYAGFISYDDERYPGEHPALIERATFYQVEALLARQRNERRSHGSNPSYLLRGLLRCGLCGAAMSPGSTRRGKREYRYYRCTTRDKLGPKTCSARPLAAAAIEDFVAARLGETSADGALARAVHTSLEERIAAERAKLLVERAKLPKAIAAASSEASRLVDSLGDLTGPARRLIEKKLTQVSDQRAAIERRLVDVERALDALDGKRIELAWVTTALADFDRVWDVMTVPNRGRLLRALLDRVVVDEPSGRVDVYLVKFDDMPLGTAPEENAA